jgi:hypothetical protein
MDGKAEPKQTRRAVFALAAVLAATALTGGAAITGLTRHGATAAPVTVAPAQVVQTPPTQVWEGDD